MRTYCKQNIVEIKELLLQLTNDQYVYGAKFLFNATIGQHVRHIIEFYQSVLVSSDSNIINYDDRERNLLIETDIDFAIEILNSIYSVLEIDIIDKHLILEGNFAASESKDTHINTTLFRELTYCLEHSIHHQALIKVGLLELNSVSFIDETFGLAPATIRYKKVCAL